MGTVYLRNTAAPDATYLNRAATLSHADMDNNFTLFLRNDTNDVLNGNLSVIGQITTSAAATQDSIIIAGRAGGTSSFSATFIPTTLTANRTLTVPDTTGTIITSGDTGTVTNTMLAGSIAISKLSATGTPSATTYLRGDGSWQTVATSGLPTVSVVTGTTQAAVASTHYVLTNVAATTVTLPASPTAGDVVWITVANSLTTNVVARNGNNIQSLAENMTIDISNTTVRLRYIDSTRGWLLT